MKAILNLAGWEKEIEIHTFNIRSGYVEVSLYSPIPCFFFSIFISLQTLLFYNIILYKFF